jgi:hypothetical protein
MKKGCGKSKQLLGATRKPRCTVPRAKYVRRSGKLVAIPPECLEFSLFSLAPTFSPVISGRTMNQPFQRLSRFWQAAESVVDSRRKKHPAKAGC